MKTITLNILDNIELDQHEAAMLIATKFYE